MLINYFLILIMLLLISGLALDAGLLEFRAIYLQNAADAAAQEGMLCLSRSDTTWATAGAAQATANGFTNGVNNVTVTLVNPPTSGHYSGDYNAVQATVSQTVTNLFMGLVNGGNSTVAATAVAKVLPTCWWIMGSAGPTSSPIFKVSSASVRPACGVYLNTATGNNLGVDYFSTLTATRIRVLGASSGNTSSGTVSPKPRFGAAPKNDPLAYVTAPTFSSCNYTSFTANSGTYTLTPGTYCNGISMSSSTVTFSPGLYIVTGGLNWQHTQISGSGVTLYLTKGGGYSYGTVAMNYVTGSISAPTASSGGSIKGVFLFGDRTWVNHNNQDLAVSNSTFTIDGIWYTLNDGLSAYNSNVSGTNYLGFVIDNFYTYLGTTRGSANYAPLSGVSPFHWEDGVLVQ